MKKFCALIATLILCTSFIKVHAAPNAPIPTADSAVLMDATTGTILYSKNPDSAFPPASTTKIMTALLTLENTSLDDQVTIGKNPPTVDGSAIGVREGEIFKVKDLLYGLLLESGNDCAAALAEHIGGTQENFVAMMNKRAKELGCTNTNFVNPHGLYNKDHKISGRDLALIMQELIKHPEYKQISTTPTYKIEPTNKCNEPRYANNHDKLVLKGTSTYYKDCIGGKTGYTIDSWHSYVAAAERDGTTLIAAFVHDTKKTYYEDSKNLFNFGFNNFQLNKLFSKGDQVSTYPLKDDSAIPLLAMKDFYYISEKNSTETPSVTLSTEGITSKAFSRGEKVIEGSVSFKGADLGRIELASGTDYAEKSVVPVLAEKSVKTASKAFKYILYAAAAFVTLFLILLLIRARNLKKRRRRRMKYISGRYLNH